jgi:hypothetical protein
MVMVMMMVTGSNSTAHRGISSSRLCIGHRRGTTPLDVQLLLIFDFKTINNIVTILTTVDEAHCSYDSITTLSRPSRR